MPVPLDPNATFSVSLESDMHIPESERPAFVFRFLPVREWKKLAAISDNMEALREGSAAGLMQTLETAITAGLVGWRNMTDAAGTPVPYDPTEFDTLLTIGEYGELFNTVLGRSAMGVSDRKKPVSPSHTNGGKSVASASRPAPAGQGQASSNPPSSTAPAAAATVAPSAKTLAASS